MSAAPGQCGLVLLSPSFSESDPEPTSPAEMVTHFVAALSFGNGRKQGAARIRQDLGDCSRLLGFSLNGCRQSAGFVLAAIGRDSSQIFLQAIVIQDRVACVGVVITTHKICDELAIVRAI